MHHIPFGFSIHAVMKKLKIGMERRGEIRELPGFLFADDLVLRGELEEDLRAMEGRFVEVCMRPKS